MRLIHFIQQIVMTDLEFLNHAEAVLKSIETGCDRINDETDADIDVQRVGSMITLVFSNQSQIIINLQKPLHEIWLAARAGGYHYRLEDGRWKDAKASTEFFENLSRCVSEQAGCALCFQP